MSGSEPFFMVPNRVHELVKGRELSFRAFALLVFLLGEADFRTKRLTVSLRSLADASGWDLTSDYLRRVLRDLRDQDLVEYRSRPGQQKPYVITITGGAVRRADLGSTSDDTRPPRSEVTSDAGGPPPAPEARRRRTRSLGRPRSDVASLERHREILDDEAELARVLEPLGRLTRVQEGEALEAWRTSPSWVRACVKDALKGRRPAGLFVSLLRDGPPAGQHPERMYLLDRVRPHPSDPNLDKVETLGPMRRDEAQRMFNDDPTAQSMRPTDDGSI